MGLARIKQANLERIYRSVRSTEHYVPRLQPRIRRRDIAEATPAGGYTGTVTVVTQIAFDANGCISSYTTVDMLFQDGLLQSVT